MRSCTEKSGFESSFEFCSELTRCLTGKVGEGKGKIESRVVVNNRGGMPSVEMRRTTRVFGLVKGVDGARVLRSGRRLWPDCGDGKLKMESGDCKVRRGSVVDEWFRPVENKRISQGSIGSKRDRDGWDKGANLKEEVIMEDVDSKSEVLDTVMKEAAADCDGDSVDRMYGMVYIRKRKRPSKKCFEISDTPPEHVSLEDRMFGIQFSRRQRRKKGRSESSVGHVGQDVSVGEADSVVITVVVESASCSRNCWFASFLYSILRYLRSSRLVLSQLSAFLSSKPISGVYSSIGIHFPHDPPTSIIIGICSIFGVRQYIPLFSVNFSALPQCFMFMYTSMLLRKCWPYALVYSSKAVGNSEEIMAYSEYQHWCISSEVNHSERKASPSEADYIANRLALHPSVRASKLAGRTAQYRNGLNYRSFQKRRSSIRTRRARNLSVIGALKPHGALVSDLINNRKNGIPFSSGVSNNKFRRSIRSNSNRIFEEVNSSTRLKLDVDLSSCNANILIIESDKCYREEGANVVLEMSDSREWLLVVKKDGLTRYSHKAQEVMRPCSCNRFTHAIIWTFDNDWKLEFPNRVDWLVFKDLYKDCSNRNVVLTSSIKIIPVPGVYEVSGYEDDCRATFSRPDSYIKLSGDEVLRALAKMTANYDMDYDDEEWLNEFNNENVAKGDINERVLEDSFELMVDAFEKAFYCNPDDYSDEAAAPNLPLDLGRREVVEAIYSYWKEKRKQKQTALLRVFQGHHPKKAPHVAKPVLRKRRSLKRLPIQFGRGKNPSVLQAMAAEQDALEEQKAMLKVKEAKVSASKSVEYAVLKRQRAQILMENADLAAYKAWMALRIAEAAQVSDSPDDGGGGAAHFLD